MRSGSVRSGGCCAWWLTAVLAVPLATFAQCPTALPSSVTKPDIAKRWLDLCNAAGKDVMGQPLSSAQVHLASSGHYQDFAAGQIAVYPRWAGKPSATMPSFIISAHDLLGGKVHVQWGSTAPYKYDYYNVRWDRDDHDEAKVEQHEHVGDFLGIGGSDPQQIEVEGTSFGGAAVIQAPAAGTNFIYVEGCTDEDDGCPEGWSYPVEIDLGNGGKDFGYSGHFFKLSPMPSFPLPPSMDPSYSPPYDMLDGPILDPSLTNQIVENQCFNPTDMIEPEDEDHAGELKSGRAEAVMMAIRDASIQCRDKDGNVYSQKELREILNQKIKDAKVVSIPGTDIGEDGRFISRSAR